MTKWTFDFIQSLEWKLLPIHSRPSGARHRHRVYILNHWACNHRAARRQQKAREEATVWGRRDETDGYGEEEEEKRKSPGKNKRKEGKEGKAQMKRMTQSSH